jgi:hypothetical protein
VGLPTAGDPVHLSVPKGIQRVHKMVSVASKNFYFERALTTAIDARIVAAARKVRARQLMFSLFAAPLLDPETGKSLFLAELTNNAMSCAKEVTFVSEYFRDFSASGLARAAKFKKMLKTSADDSTDTVDGLRMTAEGGGLRSNGLNIVAILLQPDRVGVYKSRLVVFAKDNPFDMRCIDLIATVVMTDPHAAIEFRAPARQSVMQEIPISNKSNKDWDLNINFQPISKAFSGLRSVKVPKDTVFNYELTFNGPYVAEFQGRLIFNIAGTDEYFEYRLVGITEEPLAEDHLRLRCIARSKTPFSVAVKRIPTSGSGTSIQVFKVQTDLPYLMGNPTIEVGLSGEVKYDFFINSPVSGLLTGNLTFLDAAMSAMQWYTFDVNVEPPFAESEISVSAVVRTAVVVEIMLENPSNESKIFEVDIQGEVKSIS